jgi:hypothetical protein
LSIFNGEYGYTKVTLEGYNDFSLSRRFSITNSTNAGMIDGMYPSQAGLFISPSERWVFSDFGSFIGHRLFLDQDFSGGLAGYIDNDLSGKYLFSTRVDLNVNLLNSYKAQIEPIFLLFFLEGAKLWQSIHVAQADRFTFLDAGVGLKLIGLDIDIPLWKNHKIVKNGTNCIVQPDNQLAFNSFLLRIDLTYYLKFAMEMK